MSNQTIYSRFKEFVDRHPDALAITDSRRSVSYGELDKLVDAIFSGFAGRKHSFIGVVMRHGIEQIAAMLAILKSGAAYVPAELSLPEKRRRYMMDSLGVDFVITDDYVAKVQPVNCSLPDCSRPDSPAYVLFTSGTTGKPKGVIVENHSVVNYASAFHQEFENGPGDVMLQYSVVSFDIFVEEVFTTLLNGAALSIPPQEIHDGSIDKLMNYVEANNVTIIDGFPYLIADINNLGILPDTVRLIISGGDVIRASYVTNLKAKDAKIYNTYGPSETTVCSNYFRVDNAEPLEDGTFPIGKAIRGVEVKIMDSNLREVKKGETGEICIFGEGVSRGYAGNPPEQKNFVTDREGRRFYRSGDLGYELPDGNLAFLHRKDDQVMIYGKRVEPSEVENVLNSFKEIEEGVVRAFKDDDGLHYLVAYFVLKEEIGVDELRGRLANHLADFMIPSFFVRMDRLPINSHGKVDTHSLPVVLKPLEK